MILPHQSVQWEFSIIINSIKKYSAAGVYIHIYIYISSNLPIDHKGSMVDCTPSKKEKKLAFLLLSPKSQSLYGVRLSPNTILLRLMIILETILRLTTSSCCPDDTILADTIQ